MSPHSPVAITFHRQEIKKLLRQTRLESNFEFSGKLIRFCGRRIWVTVNCCRGCRRNPFAGTRHSSKWIAKFKWPLSVLAFCPRKHLKLGKRQVTAIGNGKSDNYYSFIRDKLRPERNILAKGESNG